METVVIAGVGLIGGSFGLALKGAGFRGRIVGVSSPATIRKALERGAIDEGAELEEAARRADLVYLAGPIRAILEALPRLDGLLRPGALVTDAGSTKRQICAAGRKLRGAQFLGGHPMAGKERRGVEEADAELFRERPYLLTPESREEMQTPAAREFAGWLERIGAEPRVMTAEEHDRTVALSSHLPQMVSTALASALSGRDGVAEAAGPGLLDMTRLALSGWDIWQDILETNRDEIVRALDLFEEHLGALKARLECGLPEEDFRRGAEFARRLREGRGG
ncbi:MAG: prephenate dehydrogenase/arogenate dehydrogenase family protein [Bryobacteraceae bacterium]|jgi:prephenate dehydrogenase